MNLVRREKKAGVSRASSPSLGVPHYWEVIKAGRIKMAGLKVTSMDDRHLPREYFPLQRRPAVDQLHARLLHQLRRTPLRACSVPISV
mmetsp:Transcript_18318/g.52239  ORF Transcript_18318/g.52239 Transcript_18318/m.52239 type:complete len:88 (+) Transcript_18318:107-370(+)